MIKFLGTKTEGFNLANFLLKCNEISVQLNVQNFQNEKNVVITARPESPQDYEEVISFVEQFFTIESVEIDRTNEDQKNMFTFNDEKLNQQFELLAKAIQKCENSNIPANGYILSAIQNINARISLTSIDFEQMDVVDMNFGTNMPSEICGGHIWTIVLQKNEHESFVVPMVREPQNLEMVLPITITEDDILIDSPSADLSKTFISKKARWVSNLRANKVIGRASKNATKKIGEAILNAFDLSSSLT